jgi:hypothetical protein
MCTSNLSLCFAVLGMESRAFHMLGKCSTTQLPPQPKPSSLSVLSSYNKPDEADIMWKLMFMNDE